MNIYDAYAKKDLDLKNYKIRIKNLEEDNKYLKLEVRRISKQRDNLSSIADNLVDENRYLEEENKKLIEENDKLKDEFMLRLAEAYLLPTPSNQMAEYKQWDYSKWYDEVKNQMRKEIKEEKSDF